MTAEPKFGSCRDCACWIMSKQRGSRGAAKECRRYAALAAPTDAFMGFSHWPRTDADDGCFDHIPKETTHAR
jgi:hypothetical protein